MQDFWNGVSGSTLSLKSGSLNLLYGGLPSFAFLLGVFAQYVFYFGLIYFLLFKGRKPSESRRDYLKRICRSLSLQFRSKSHLKWVIGIALLFLIGFAFIKTKNMVQTVTTYAQYANKTTSGSKTATMVITTVYNGTRRSFSGSVDGAIQMDEKASFVHIVNANKQLANDFLQDGSDGKLYTVTIYLDQDGQPYAVEPFLAE